ncbi:MAG: hypothetical protein V4693_04960 [Pseudomonadota bacterium]
MSNNLPIQIVVGERGSTFSAKNAPNLKVDEQPAGINFYTIRFTPKSRGRALILVGHKPFSIDHVISITGSEDVDLREEGISEFHINSSIDGSGTILHDDARLKFFNIVRNITNAGWRSIIPRGMARLRGKSMTQYLLENKKYTTLDASYIPSLNEWMRIPSLTVWEFYLDQTYLSLKFTRENSLQDPLKPGAYLVSFDIQSEAEYFRSYVDSSDRKNWREILPKELRTLAESRAKMEEAMRKKGEVIDSAYVDPRVTTK